MKNDGLCLCPFFTWSLQRVMRKQKRNIHLQILLFSEKLLVETWPQQESQQNKWLKYVLVDTKVHVVRTLEHEHVILLEPKS